jgi:hypothetical protein
MNARVIFWWGKGGRCVVLTMFPLPLPIVLKCGSLNLLETPEPVQACTGIDSPTCEGLRNWVVIFTIYLLFRRLTVSFSEWLHVYRDTLGLTAINSFLYLCKENELQD